MTWLSVLLISWGILGSQLITGGATGMYAFPWEGRVLLAPEEDFDIRWNRWQRLFFCVVGGPFFWITVPVFWVLKILFLSLFRLFEWLGKFV
jgi:hypothetical protein